MAEGKRIDLAARCLPSERQLAWQKLEFTCFVHFGINTFTGREWGNGKEQPSLFAPTSVDTDQWCREAKAAGMAMMLITLKHHDGFCLWQTRYNTPFSLKSSPWKEGKGDVLAMLSASCRKYGLKIGIYLSPADLYQMESAQGLYGNGSIARESTIPTDPASFLSQPKKGRTPPIGKPVFSFQVDDYNRYMLNGLYECLTEYGRIDEVWFDGAHPKQKGNQQYAEKAWFSMIRQLAPHAVIAVGGPDVRWCGNEHGATRKAEWSVMPLCGKWQERSGWRFVKGVNARSALQAGRSQVEAADFVHWWPSEVDTSIRHGWFWRDESQHVRSAEEIFDIYERSVGSNSLLLLNVPPNREGKFSPRDVAVLRKVGKRITATYGREVSPVTFERKTQHGGVYKLKQASVFNRLVLQENIEKEGQRVERYLVEIFDNGQWKELGRGETIGYKKIMRFDEVKAQHIRLSILETRAPLSPLKMQVFRDIAPLKIPVITRNQEGYVKIEGKGSLYYTLDGSEPSDKSMRYTKPFLLADGGTIKAVARRGDQRSEVLTTRYDIAPIGWKITASSQNAPSGEVAQKAIDGNPQTLWHSQWSGKTESLPHSLTIDFGKALDLKGFSYLPRQDALGGIIDRYRLEVSKDGATWALAVEGRFDNIKNNPSLRDVLFERTWKGMRFMRLTSLHSIENKPHSSAAELGVITR